jgi:hypothetical protein
VPNVALRHRSAPGRNLRFRPVLRDPPRFCGALNSTASELTAQRASLTAENAAVGSGRRNIRSGRRPLMDYSA